MRKIQVKAKHEVHVTYTVEANSQEEAVEKLCGIDLFTEYCGEPATFGPNEWAMQDAGAEVVDMDCYGDPAPTGAIDGMQQSWEWEDVTPELGVKTNDTNK